jgi:hypothetical protein
MIEDVSKERATSIFRVDKLIAEKNDKGWARIGSQRKVRNRLKGEGERISGP